MPTNTAPVTYSPVADLDTGARDLADIRLRGTSDRDRLGLITFNLKDGRLAVVGAEYMAFVTFRTTGKHRVVRVTKDTGRTVGTLDADHLSPFDIAALVITLVD